MKKYLCFFTLIVALIIVYASQPINAFAAVSSTDGYCRTPYFKVTATEKNKVQPDCAYINFSVETKNLNLEEAQNDNAQRIKNLLDTLTTNNIAEEDMKTMGFYVYPEYDYCFGMQKFLGYKVSNHLRVKIKDIEKLGKIIDEATDNGANTISGIEFSLEDNSPAYNEALVKSVNAAKEKALEVSRAVGANNINIISVNEIMNGYCGGFEFARVFDSAAAKTSVIKHGALEISATVELKYELVY